jgi:hypothetical protein
MMGLYAAFLNHRGRPIQKWKHYFPIYEDHFGRFVNRPVTLFEIGCGSGGSLQLWKSYFGPLAQIVGIDVDPQCQSFEEDQISVRIGHQADVQFLDAVIREFGNPDIVIDDGSHLMADITTSFIHLYERTDRNGVYLVEDLHTAYWSEYGGGIGRSGSFIELCKQLIDQLHAHWTREDLNQTMFNRTTLSMHFYDSIIVFEKGRNRPRVAAHIPEPDLANPVATDRYVSFIPARPNARDE